MIPADAFQLDPDTLDSASQEAVGSRPADEFSALGFESTDQHAALGAVHLEEDCLPVGIVAEAVEATARSQAEAVRKDSAARAGEVLAEAEREVHELLSGGLPEAEFAARSADIVTRADRVVRQILAQGRTDAEVVEMRAGHQAAELRAHAAAMLSPNDFGDAEPMPGPHLTLVESDQPDDLAAQAPAGWADLAPATDTYETASDRHAEPEDEAPVEVLMSPQAIVEMSGGRSTADGYFATLRALPLPPTDGIVAYRVAGSLTLATMLAFEEAVSRLPGVGSASVTPEPGDLATLKLTTSDAALLAPLLVCLPGIQLEIEAA
jgi:hypothetical protein